jgi:hypothetical protein
MSEKRIKTLRKSLNHKIFPKYVPEPVLKEDTTQEMVSIQVGPRTITYPKVTPILNDQINKETYKAYKQAKKVI